MLVVISQAGPPKMLQVCAGSSSVGCIVVPMSRASPSWAAVRVAAPSTATTSANLTTASMLLRVVRLRVLAPRQVDSQYRGAVASHGDLVVALVLPPCCRRARVPWLCAAPPAGDSHRLRPARSRLAKQ